MSRTLPHRKDAESPNLSSQMDTASEDVSIPVTSYPRPMSVEALFPEPHPISRALPEPPKGSGSLVLPLQARPFDL